MKNLLLALMLLTATTTHVVAQPAQVFVEDTTANSFQFFVLDKKATNVNKVQLANEIFPTIPVYLKTDINQTPIEVPGAKFGTNQMYSYWSNFTFPEFKSTDKVLAKVVKQKFTVNFRSPVGLVPGDSTGGVVHVHFAKPVTYFGAWFSGRADLSLTDNVQYIINNVAITQDVSSGLPTFIGVEDIDGFTDLDIVPVGGMTQAYLFDKPSFK